MRQCLLINFGIKRITGEFLTEQMYFYLYVGNKPKASKGLGIPEIL